MNMVGMTYPRRTNSRRNSGPDIPGIATSEIKQTVLTTSDESSSSGAVAKVLEANPNSLSRSGSDSRTDSSSSTTDTNAAGLVISLYTSNAALHVQRPGVANSIESGDCPNTSRSCSRVESAPAGCGDLWDLGIGSEIEHNALERGLTGSRRYCCTRGDIGREAVIALGSKS
jgi:hypothetical protein